MSDLKARLLKNTTLEKTSMLADSSIFQGTELIDTGIPMLNVACSGRLNKGLGPGLLMIAGPSKNFKTGLSLILASAFLKGDKDATLLFYNSEFGTPQSYFDKFGIDSARVIHTPITDIEQLKHDIMAQLKEVTDKDKLMIVIDSIGNLASKKEVDDAVDGKVVADMTRAKAFKSLFRMVTPHLSLKGIPMVAVNHTYKEMASMYPREIVGGGCVVSGTLVKTLEGDKVIENITLSDKVLTQFGYQRVLEIWNVDNLADPAPECLEIEFEDGTKVVCSKEHSFLQGDNWVEAEDLKEGQYVSKI